VTEFVRVKAENEVAPSVAALGYLPDHHTALFWDATQPRLQDVTLAPRDGAAVGAPAFVLMCHFLVLEAGFTGGRRS
jgi:hypothetical protein